MLDELSSRGTSILLTTHHLDEAETQCDRIVIVDHGRIVAIGSFEELVKRTIGIDRHITLRLDQRLRDSGNERLAVSGITIKALPGEPAIEARIHDVAAELPRLLDAVRDAGYGVMDVDVQNPSLHHVFLHLTGHALRD